MLKFCCWDCTLKLTLSLSLSLSLSPSPHPTKNLRSLTKTSAPHSDGSHLLGFRFTSLTQRSAYRKVIYRDCACSSVCLSVTFTSVAHAWKWIVKKERAVSRVTGRGRRDTALTDGIQYTNFQLGNVKVKRLLEIHRRI